MVCVQRNLDNTPCTRQVVAKGMCGMHYRRERRFKLGEGRNPAEVGLPTERYSYPISSRVSAEAGGVLERVLAERQKVNPRASHYELVRDIIHEWAKEQSK